MPPALLTLFIDVIIVSRFAFHYHKPLLRKIPRWERLLTDRTATILSTMDSPPFFMKLHDRDPGGKMMKDVLSFTGISTTSARWCCPQKQSGSNGWPRIIASGRETANRIDPAYSSNVAARDQGGHLRGYQYAVGTASALLLCSAQAPQASRRMV